jgi:ubiquinone/menaquinone biosynthesis C-methylase UbiE
VIFNSISHLSENIKAGDDQVEIKDKDIYSFYENIDEDMRLKRTKANRIEFLTTIHYLDKVIKPNSKILDACAGGGIYAFHLAKKGHKVIAGDLIKCHAHS